MAIFIWPQMVKWAGTQNHLIIIDMVKSNMQQAPKALSGDVQEQQELKEHYPFSGGIKKTF